MPMGSVWTEVTMGCPSTLEEQDSLVFLLGTAPSLAQAWLGEITHPRSFRTRVTKSGLTEAKLPWG